MQVRPLSPTWLRSLLFAPRGLPPYTRMTMILIGMGTVAAAGAVLAWVLVVTEAPKPRDGYALVRLRTVEAQAEQIEGDYVLLAGDSHTERLYLPELCGLPTLNAGLSGATLADVASFLSAAGIRSPKLTLLSIGTNDANLKRDPDAGKAHARFRQNLDTLLSILHWKGTRVVVSQVPPLRDAGSTGFSAAAITGFDAIISDICSEEQCRRVELFPAADAAGDPKTSGKPVWHEPVHAPDGIHINRLADRIRAHASDICSYAIN
ncbi:SGNH/GDSL hydrolase family protein [Pseudochelatococcus sp. B33]